MWPFYISGGAALIAVLILLAMKYKKQLPTILMLPLFPFFFIAFLVYVFVNPKERRKINGDTIFGILFFVVIIAAAIWLIIYLFRG